MARVVRSPVRCRGLVLPALLLAGLVIVAPLAAAAPVVHSDSPAAPMDLSADPGVTAPTVTWNGVNVSSHGQPSSAFSVAGTHSAEVNFSFSEPTLGFVTNVTLQLTYLGLVLTTARTAPTVPGPDAHLDVPSLISAHASLNWTFGPLAQALEGVFQLSAGLTNSTGATVWSETFFVFVKSPYLVESASVVVLLILLVAELYWGVAAIRIARKSARPPVASWSGAQGSTPPSSGTPPPPAGSGTPPASGGGPSGGPPPGSTGGGGST